MVLAHTVLVNSLKIQIPLSMQKKSECQMKYGILSSSLNVSFMLKQGQNFTHQILNVNSQKSLVSKGIFKANKEWHLPLLQ